ncbi:MAG: hypothetical protein E7625_06635 [Ruminococcaceae bacterium]|nr:hypothetical protein [Oscillospiraceae bacterium]
MDPKYQALFTPWKIGNVEIKNRMVMCPMGGTSLFGRFELTGCKFDKEAAKFFLERAKNNVGLIMPVVDSLGDEFLDYVKDGMTVTVCDDGTVTVESSNKCSFCKKRGTFCMLDNPACLRYNKGRREVSA